MWRGFFRAKTPSRKVLDGAGRRENRTGFKNLLGLAAGRYGLAGGFFPPTYVYSRGRVWRIAFYFYLPSIIPILTAMLRFFCKIRQNLLTQGRIGRYLSYAVGEIVLVVIGILISVQLNNWNEARKNRPAERAFAESFLVDLHQDVRLIDYVIDFNN